MPAVGKGTNAFATVAIAKRAPLLTATQVANINAEVAAKRRIMEDHPTHLGQKKTIDLHRGIFIIRYSSAKDDAFPPKVKISVAPGSDANISAILHPDERETVLWQPGSGLVIQAHDAGQLLVEVTPTRVKGSAAATVKIESLTQGNPAVEIGTGNDRTPHEDSALVAQIVQDLRLLGHVAGRGDVAVGANEWIAGPSAPSRIEGIAIDWSGKPRDLTIRYAVKTARADVGPVDLGAFAGTRGRALPLVGVMIELSGPAASDYQLTVDAAFLGSPARSVRGQNVVVAGPTGREPLVGIRLRIEHLAATTKPRMRAMEEPKTQPRGRVRVFRSTDASRG